MFVTFRSQSEYLHSLLTNKSEIYIYIVLLSVSGGVHSQTGIPQEKMKILWVALFLSAHSELTLTLLIRTHVFINTALSWSDAQSFCRENHYDLSTLDSQEEVDRFKADGKNHMSTESWVGLSKPSATGEWVWSDGSQESFLTWKSGQPNDPDTDFCAKSTNGELYDFNCNQKYPFFCYYWMPPLILVMEQKTWEEAFQYCRTKHNGLACLPTRLHLLQVQNHTEASDAPSVWTGLRFLAGSWFWVNGEALGTLVSLQACPANALYCGSRNLGAKSWENRNCIDKLNFVCY